MTKIPVIDLFAGPGGLGEGFSSIKDAQGKRAFDIKLSIEKDEHAHNTLKLRSFYRKFVRSEVPELYYKYIKEDNLNKKAKLFEQLKMIYTKQWTMAENEAWHLELPYPEEFDNQGNKKGGYTTLEINRIHNEIDQKISDLLKESGEFLLIGGPPCQAYSLAGRARNQGISGKDHRVHLYKEYLRIIAKHNPLVFVMENVKGLLSAEIDNIKVFDLIKDDLKTPQRVFPESDAYQYKVYSFVKEPDYHDENGFPVYNSDSDFLIESEKYNIPQRRHRVILLGIREDVALENIKTLNMNKNTVSLKEVIGALPKLRSGIGREIAGTNHNGNHLYNNIRDNYENWKNSVKGYQKMLKEQFAFEMTDLIESDNRGGNYQKFRLAERDNPLYKNWFKDDKLKGVLNHESRTHLKEDLGRYIFSSVYLKEKGDFPKLKDYPEWLLPDHKNAKKGDKFADRFRTQRPDQPATTITSHISKDGHYFIHYDPEQCRSLTVREAARIQTFPDNYYFCGSRTHQYQQVGNAVPPYLAKQIAEIIFEIFKNYERIQASE